MQHDQQQLLRRLVETKLLTNDLLDSINQKSQALGLNPEEVIIAENLVDEDKLTLAKAALFGLPSINLVGFSINKKVLALISSQAAAQYEAVAFRRAGTLVDVGVVNPQNFKAIEVVTAIADASGLKVRFFVISQSSLNSALRQYAPVDYNFFASPAAQAIDETPVAVSEVAVRSAGEIPVSKLLLVIVATAIEGRASDIHIEPTGSEVRIRYRIDGRLQTSFVLPKYTHAPLVAKLKSLAQLDSANNQTPQSGHCQLLIGDQSIDFRLTTLPLFDGEKVVLRLLNPAASRWSLRQLGFLPAQIEAITRTVSAGRGLIIVAGPQGSGKTETLYALLNQINSERRNIITLEDPIQHYLPGVNQSQVDISSGYDYSAALQAIVRQDPDVIMVHALTTASAVQEVLRFSSTGRLILSRLHVKDSLAAVRRLIDFVPDTTMVANALHLIITQRLIRKVCQFCKRESPISDRVAAEIKKYFVDIPDIYKSGIDLGQLEFFTGEGCARCGHLGYHDRAIVAEVLAVTPAIRQLLVVGGRASAIQDELANQQFLNLFQSALLHAAHGIITLEDALNIGHLALDYA